MPPEGPGRRPGGIGRGSDKVGDRVRFEQMPAGASAAAANPASARNEGMTSAPPPTAAPSAAATSRSRTPAPQPLQRPPDFPRSLQRHSTLTCDEKTRRRCRKPQCPLRGAPMSLSFTPLLADTLYISGGVIGAVLVLLLVIWLLRRT